MGLNFNYSDARWSYDGFDRFRKRLATQIGINLDDMQGFSSLLVKTFLGMTFLTQSSLY